jgi:RNA polymerase sigma-70 factor (ECF subfamily)
MTHEGDELPTKATLIGRLKNWKDQSSWQEFFDIYWKLIYGVARKAGLSDAEAQDVLQATVAAVSEQMPTFKYNPLLGSFKSWLLNITRLQIITRSLKRRSSGSQHEAVMESETSESVARVWDTEWRNNMTQAAVTNVRRRLDPKKYQIYDFCVNKKWSPEKVAPVFGVSVEEAREAVDSIAKMIEAELKRLEREML